MWKVWRKTLVYLLTESTIEQKATTHNSKLNRVITILFLIKQNVYFNQPILCFFPLMKEGLIFVQESVKLGNQWNERKVWIGTCSIVVRSNHTPTKKYTLKIRILTSLWNIPDHFYSYPPTMRDQSMMTTTTTNDDDDDDK